MMAIGATEAQIAIKVLELAVKQGWLDKFLNAFRKKNNSCFRFYWNRQNEFFAVFD
jgi:hypothetical protein